MCEASRAELTNEYIQKNGTGSNEDASMLVWGRTLLLSRYLYVQGGFLPK